MLPAKIVRETYDAEPDYIAIAEFDPVFRADADPNAPLQTSVLKKCRSRCRVLGRNFAAMKWVTDYQDPKAQIAAIVRDSPIIQAAMDIAREDGYYSQMRFTVRQEYDHDHTANIFTFTYYLKPEHITYLKLKYPGEI